MIRFALLLLACPLWAAESVEWPAVRMSSTSEGFDVDGFAQDVADDLGAWRHSRTGTGREAQAARERYENRQNRQVGVGDTQGPCGHWGAPFAYRDQECGWVDADGWETMQHVARGWVRSNDGWYYSADFRWRENSKGLHQRLVSRDNCNSQIGYACSRRHVWWLDERKGGR